MEGTEAAQFIFWKTNFDPVTYQLKLSDAFHTQREKKKGKFKAKQTNKEANKSTAELRTLGRLILNLVPATLP